MSNFYEEALKVYANEPCKYTLDQEIQNYMENGFVLMDDDIFVMARMVRSDWTYEQITDSALPPAEEPDCWHIGLAVGDLRTITSKFEIWFEYSSYERMNELRIIKTKTFHRLCHTSHHL